jgi:hypothetical protein
MALEDALDVDLVVLETADEVSVLLQLAARSAGVQAVTVVIRPAETVPGLTLWNDLPVRGLDDGVMAELGDFHACERRQVLLGLLVPALGPTTICELEVRWVDPGSMTASVATARVKTGELRRAMREDLAH